MKKQTLNDGPKLLQDLVESLGQAEGACSQLIHHLQHPGFIVVRQLVTITKENTLKTATANIMKMGLIKS